MCSNFVRRLMGGTALLVAFAMPFPCSAKDYPVSLGDNLHRLGLKFDCEFTVEKTYTKGGEQRGQDSLSRGFCSFSNSTTPDPNGTVVCLTAVTLWRWRIRVVSSERGGVVA